MAVENTDTILPYKRCTRFYQTISPNKGYSYYIYHETLAWMYLITSLLRDFRNYVQENQF